jgi:zinc protease
VIARRIGIIGIVLLLLTAAGAVQAQDRPSVDVRSFTLDNGLRVFMARDTSSPVAAVNLTYNVGGADDPAGRSGFAHLFEHLMFEETANLEAGELDRLVERVGGVINAYTDVERTVYFTVLPAHHLPLALWFESDRMASLRVSTPNFDNQRAIVIEEYRQNVRNVPYGDAFEVIYTLPHTVPAYRNRVIGSVPDLNAASVRDAIAFHDAYYLPNNAVLTIAGDIDFGETERLVRAYFSPIPRGERPPIEGRVAGTPTAGRYDFLDPLAPVNAALIGYPIPPRRDRDYPALEVAARIVGQGASSRLAVSLLDTGTAVDAGAFAFANRAEGLFVAYAFGNLDVPMSFLENGVRDALQRIVDDGVTPGELTKAVNSLRAERFFSLETAEGLASAVADGQFHYDDPRGMIDEIDRVAAVTPEDVRRVVRDYLTPARATILLVQPVIQGVGGESQDELTAATSSPEDADVTSTPRAVLAQTTPPDPLPARPFTLPPISEARLDNGLTVITIERPELPIVLLNLVLPGGTSAVPAAQAGLADLTAAAMLRGTTSRSALAIANAIESTGGAINSAADPNAITISAYTLRPSAPVAFEIMADVVQRATLPDSEVAVLRDMLFTNLENEFADGGALAMRTFNSLVYGTHPYGRLPTTDSLATLTPDMARFFYSTQSAPGRALLVVAGAISPRDAEALAREHFGGWSSPNAAPALLLPDPTPASAPGIYLVDRPGSAQADIVIGRLAIAGGDPDRDTLTMLNGVLGGTFGARLGRVIREELGYTYGIYSRVGLSPARGTLAIVTATGNAVTVPALRAIDEQFALLRSQPVPEDERLDVLDGIINSQALAFETSEALANALIGLRLNGLPASELREQPQRLRAVDAAAIQRAAAVYLAREDLITVVVGDAALLAPELAALGNVTLLEAR